MKIFRIISLITAIIIITVCAFGCGQTGNQTKDAVRRTAAVLPDYTFEGDAQEFVEDFEKYSEWFQVARENRMASMEIADQVQDFYATSIKAILTSKEENTVCSPLNIYIALATAAKTANGQTQAQILDLLGAPDMDALTENVQKLWLANYVDNPLLKSRLATSLWLRNDIGYNETLLNELAEEFYTDTYRGEMGSDDMNAALSNWTDEATGNLLKEYTSDMKTDPGAVMELVSTIYFKAFWISRFQTEDTKTEVFHGASGDSNCQMMHQSGSDIYFWGDNFSAVSLPLTESGSMYFFLPDEGVSLEEMIDNDQVMEVITKGATLEYNNNKYLIVNKSIPKFSVSSKNDIKDTLIGLGMTDAFDPGNADFSGLTDAVNDIWISKVDHAAIVEIDEEGVTGAAYTDMMFAGSGMPPEEEVDFVLDRPFLFVVTGADGSFLFAGTVYNIGE